MRMTRTPVLVPLLALLGCSEGSPSGPDADAKVGALVSNNLVDAATQERLGLVSIRGCSGVLLRNDWLATASHCFPVETARNPNTLLVDAGWGTGAAGAPLTQTRAAAAIYRFWGTDTAQGDGWSRWDLALVRLATPFVVNGSQTGFRANFSERSLAAMNGVTVRAYGIGINRLASGSGPTAMSSSTDDSFRSADFTVDQIESRHYSMPTGATTLAGGDSGGPSFEVAADGSLLLAGIHSKCEGRCLPGQQCPESDLWTWMQFVDRCADAPIAQLRGTIEELMDQTWDPRAEVAVFRAKHSEGAVGNDLLLGQLDGLPWAYARRAAQRMCLNRGFLAGVATGHHTPGDSYEVMCFGPSGRFYDAGQAEVDATGHGYTSPDETGWARAGRVAAGLCAQKHPGSPGGFMTGYRREGVGIFPALMGVFCLDGDAGRWADATTGALGLAGDLDETAWASAGRAATSWCRNRPLFGGQAGFLNGHQLGANRGTVCVGSSPAGGQEVDDTPPLSFDPHPRATKISRAEKLDFDGDGRADVFTTVARDDGYHQWYASSGGGSYRALAFAAQSVAELRFGDFDGDGRTDVFTAVAREDGLYQWYFSSAGVGSYRPLAYAAQPLDQLRFGDFDGDGRTDVFTAIPREDGLYQWYFSSAGVGAYRPLAFAAQPLDELRFGNFDGDGSSDVFTATPRPDGSYQWHFSSGGVGGYRALARADQPLAELRLADLDGDDRTDVFTLQPREDGLSQWLFSSGAARSYAALAYAGQTLDELRLADLDGDGRADVFTVTPLETGGYQWYRSSAGVGGYVPLRHAAQALSELRLGNDG